MTRKPGEKTFSTVQEWFEALDKFNSEPFFYDREQPLALDRTVFEDDVAKSEHDA